MVIWVDNKEVVDGFGRGRTWCCAAARPAADLWKRLWDLVADIGPGIDIRKCKGHATMADVTAGRSTAFYRVGNDNADHFAGRGVDLAEHEVPSEQLKAQYRVAQQWYAWLLTLCSAWPEDTQPKPPRTSQQQQAVPKRLPAMRPLELHASRPHELLFVPRHGRAAGRWECEACKRHSSFEAADVTQRRFAMSPCPGRLVERARDIATVTRALDGFGRGHELMLTGAITWCRLCGAYGESRMRKLHQPCNGPAHGSSATQLRRLSAGIHPVSGLPLQ